MGKIKYGLALVVFVFGSTTSQAALITITPEDCTSGDCWEFSWPDNSAALHADDVEVIVGETEELQLFYKSDQGGGESGLFASSYETTFSNTSSDPQDALIAYISGAAIDCGTCYLVIKDGAAIPGNYIYDLSDLSYLSLSGAWDGLASIFLDGFWPDKGAISNVAIYGVVPLPAAFWLFGTALIGFIGVSRRTAV